MDEQLGIGIAEASIIASTVGLQWVRRDHNIQHRNFQVEALKTLDDALNAFNGNQTPLSMEQITATVSRPYDVNNIPFVQMLAAIPCGISGMDSQTKSDQETIARAFRYSIGLHNNACFNLAMCAVALFEVYALEHVPVEAWPARMCTEIAQFVVNTATKVVTDPMFIVQAKKFVTDWRTYTGAIFGSDLVPKWPLAWNRVETRMAFFSGIEPWRFLANGHMQVIMAYDAILRTLNQKDYISAQEVAQKFEYLMSSCGTLDPYATQMTRGIGAALFAAIVGHAGIPAELVNKAQLSHVRSIFKMAVKPRTTQFRTCRTALLPIHAIESYQYCGIVAICIDEGEDYMASALTVKRRCRSLSTSRILMPAIEYQLFHEYRHRDHENVELFSWIKDPNLYITAVDTGIVALEPLCGRSVWWIDPETTTLSTVISEPRKSIISEYCCLLSETLAQEFNIISIGRPPKNTPIANLTDIAHGIFMTMRASSGDIPSNMAGIVAPTYKPVLSVFNGEYLSTFFHSLKMMPRQDKDGVSFLLTNGALSLSIVPGTAELETQTTFTGTGGTEFWLTKAGALRFSSNGVDYSLEAVGLPGEEFELEAVKIGKSVDHPSEWYLHVINLKDAEIPTPDLAEVMLTLRSETVTDASSALPVIVASIEPRIAQDLVSFPRATQLLYVTPASTNRTDHVISHLSSIIRPSSQITPAEASKRGPWFAGGATKTLEYLKAMSDLDMTYSRFLLACNLANGGPITRRMTCINILELQMAIDDPFERDARYNLCSSFVKQSRLPKMMALTSTVRDAMLASTAYSKFAMQFKERLGKLMKLFSPDSDVPSQIMDKCDHVLIAYSADMAPFNELTGACIHAIASGLIDSVSPEGISVLNAAIAVACAHAHIGEFFARCSLDTETKLTPMCRAVTFALSGATGHSPKMLPTASLWINHFIETYSRADQSKTLDKLGADSQFLKEADECWKGIPEHEKWMTDVQALVQLAIVAKTNKNASATAWVTNLLTVWKRLGGLHVAAIPAFKFVLRFSSLSWEYEVLSFAFDDS